MLLGLRDLQIGEFGRGDKFTVYLAQVGKVERGEETPKSSSVENLNFLPV